jgi:hypothetical protein
VIRGTISGMPCLVSFLSFLSLPGSAGPCHGCSLPGPSPTNPPTHYHYSGPWHATHSQLPTPLAEPACKNIGEEEPFRDSFGEFSISSLAALDRIVLGFLSLLSLHEDDLASRPNARPNVLGSSIRADGAAIFLRYPRVLIQYYRRLQRRTEREPVVSNTELECSWVCSLGRMSKVVYMLFGACVGWKPDLTGLDGNVSDRRRYGWRDATEWNAEDEVDNRIWEEDEEELVVLLILLVSHCFAVSPVTGGVLQCSRLRLFFGESFSFSSLFIGWGLIPWKVLSVSFGYCLLEWRGGGALGRTWPGSSHRDSPKSKVFIIFIQTFYIHNRCALW